MQPFTPGSSVRINVSASSQSTLITPTPGVRQVRVMNDGSATVWLAFGGSAVTATVATGLPLPAGAVEVLTIKKSDGPIYAAAIAAGATGYVYFTPGSGI